VRKNISAQFLFLTGSIMLVSWGACVAFSLAGFSLNKDYWMYLPYLVGGWSPTIASYFVLKNNRQIAGLKDWLKNVFDVKRSIWAYLTMLLFAVAYFIPQILISGMTKMQPAYMLIVLTPLMLFGGGLEEAGWRYILQPELDAKVGYILSSIVVSAIWAVWHLPLFFIAGTGQSDMNFGFFIIGIIGLTFALGALRKVTKSVFLCVLLHSLVNAGRGVFLLKDTLEGTAAEAALLVILSVCIVAFYKWKAKKAC
jgi:membrane protease YdiL (CAAX protease family)